MHPIIAGKKRNVIQTIQEETATNIYFPSPLQGVFATDPTGTSPSGRSTNAVWITGEFFGVQRARDMLYQVSLNKVSDTSIHVSNKTSPHMPIAQQHLLKRHRDPPA
jgi:hypothetical protein